MNIPNRTTETNTVGSEDWLAVSKNMKISAHIEGQDMAAQLQEPLRRLHFMRSVFVEDKNPEIPNNA